MPRTIGELAAHADEMAAQMRDVLPDPSEPVDRVFDWSRDGAAERVGDEPHSRSGLLLATWFPRAN